jgi:alginate O-acetyltransferase complex protein AlgI
MLFQSQFFVLVFLPFAVLAYYFRAHSREWREWCLLTASFVFYGWWDVRFIPLLVGQIGITWALAKLHERTKSNWPLWAGIGVNLASLGTFKYLNFIFTSVMAAIGAPQPPFDIVLPIGISFFSFQLISYLIDRMRDDAPIYPLRRFALFVTFFPHLIAGPIVRHNELIPQFEADPWRPGFAQRLGMGLFLFTIGFAKKVLFADRLAEVVNSIFAEPAAGSALAFGRSWNAVLGFSLQIYLDFSAYTDMAIGVALLFGLMLPENFRRPYHATNLSDFWRRWHMSLSFWIRDYVYIPLGGNRKGLARKCANLILAMGICGIWHGLELHYFLWGVFHGVLLSIESVCNHRNWHPLRNRLGGAYVPVKTVIIFGLVTFSWLLFKYQMPDFLAYMRGLMR